jgi:threonylcarbamoyladenosine tRNA methylthiotransferase MtaB
MPAIPVALRRERAGRLREAGQAASAHFHSSLVGQQVSVLLENATHGHSQHFAPVRARGATALGEAGQLVAAVVRGSDGAGLLVERI